MKTYFSLRNLFSGNLFPSKASTEPKEEEILTPRDMLLADIKKTMEALDVAYSGLDNATDPDLIDCYIYEVNATLKRYRFLIHQAELMEIVTPYASYEEKYSTIPVPTPLASTMLLEAE